MPRERGRLVVMRDASTEPPLQQGPLPKRALRSARSTTILQHNSSLAVSGEEVCGPHSNDVGRERARACSYAYDKKAVYIHIFMPCSMHRHALTPCAGCATTRGATDEVEPRPFQTCVECRPLQWTHERP